MKARRKTGVIDVQRYEQEAVQAWPPGVRFLPTEGGVSVWNEPQQTWVRVHDGDYVRIDNPDDIYPIGADAFAELYDQIDDPVPA